MTYRNGYVRKLAVFAVAIALASAGLSVYLWLELRAEINERRDTSCDAAEKAYRDEIDDLEESYDLFLNPPVGFKRVLQDPRAIRSLREEERDVRRDDDEFGQYVSPSCDEPEFGLPEPDPEIPQRPPSLEPEALK